MRWFKTDVSQARLRMLESRGVVTATMIYDYLPINDSFKKIDENSVLGLMDYKVISQPFFFVLQRDIPLWELYGEFTPKLPLKMNSWSNDGAGTTHLKNEEKWSKMINLNNVIPIQ